MSTITAPTPADWRADTETCLRGAEDESWMIGAPNVPIFQSSLFTVDSIEEFHDRLDHESDTVLYQRGVNPTVRVLERKLTALERGGRAKCFASGVAAIAAAVSSVLRQGDRAVVIGDVYGPAIGFFRYLERWGVGVDHVRDGDLAAVERAIRPTTRVLYTESPTSADFRVIDLSAVAALARARRLTTIVDNTWCSPLFQKPLTIGIDLVIQSLSKYLGGHSDLVGGVVIGSGDRIAALAATEGHLLGAALSPHVASLVLRGLRTLPIRMGEHDERGRAIARALTGLRGVASVDHPGLPGHPDHTLATRQQSGFGSLFRVNLRLGDADAVSRFFRALTTVRIGVSWGGFESLATTPRSSMARATLGEAIPVRLFVGLEPTEDIIDDIERALVQALDG